MFPTTPTQPTEKAKKYSYVFFDLHLTLIQAYPSYNEIYSRIIKEQLNLTVSAEKIELALQKNWQRYDKRILAKEISSIRTPVEYSQWWTNFHSKVVLLLSHDVSEEKARKFGEVFNLRFCSDPSLFKVPDTTIEVLQYCHSKSIKTAIITNCLPEVKNIICAFGLDALVDEIIISMIEGHQKPNPLILSNFLKDNANFHPNEALVVGDSLTDDIALGHNLNIDSCLLSAFPKSTEELAPTYTVKSLRELLTIL